MIDQRPSWVAAALHHRQAARLELSDGIHFACKVV